MKRCLFIGSFIALFCAASSLTGCVAVYDPVPARNVAPPPPHHHRKPAPPPGHHPGAHGPRQPAPPPGHHPGPPR